MNSDILSNTLSQFDSLTSSAAIHKKDPEVQLLVPSQDVPRPKLTICVPALNESLTIATFIDWCQSGLQNAGIAGEILIVDSSSDNTAEIAVSKGARVLKTPQRGLGRAYIDALPYIRGEYIILGDCDCTYDFRELRPFVKSFLDGNEFIMGSRFKGKIEPGAMPPLHQYFGTPITTWILNLIYSSHFSDIHCGMRGITKKAFEAMQMKSQSWEYASEMVLKSVHMDLKTAEVQIHFLKDQEGRLSHHKREGWFSPWKAAWINLKAMFIYGPTFFLYKPGIPLFIIGTFILFGLSLGPVTIGKFTLSIYWMLLGLTFATVGLQSIYMGILSKVFFDFSGEHSKKWLKIFTYTPAVFGSAGLFFLGWILLAPLLITYTTRDFTLSAFDWESHIAIVGLFLIIISFMTFTFTLLLHASQVAFKKPGFQNETR